MSRPDVQPDVLEAVRRSLWAFCRDLETLPCEEDTWPRPRRNPADLLRYDGGEGDRSGQLSWDLLAANDERGPVRLTSEVDQLLAGACEEEVYETDWKTGHKLWTPTAVKGAFQFKFHTWLICRNHPAVQTVHVRVWMTRFNSPTSWVHFRRRDADEFEGVLLGAVQARDEMLLSIGEQDGRDLRHLAWPSKPKCLICPAIQICPYRSIRAWHVREDFAESVRAYQVIEIALADLKADLIAVADAHGGRYKEEGLGFGVKARKPTKTRPTYGVFEAGNPDPEPKETS